jgi:hypothetical protein
VHRDFKLVERGEPLRDPKLAGLRDALRDRFPVPTDTFITEDIPALLTRLSQPR